VVLSIDFADGLVIDLAYDDAGRATQIGNLWAVGSYNAAGQVLSETYGNDVTQATSMRTACSKKSR